MKEVCSLVWSALVGVFRTRAALEAEILILRHQLNVLRRQSPKRQSCRILGRLIFASLYCLAPKALDALAIVQPETVIRWHRAGFRLYWRWKSRRHGGRPRTPLEIRRLIREMSIANPLWGAPRIHGELLKLGIEIGQTSVAKYMARRRGPPSQGWKTFLQNNADGIAAMDLFVVPRTHRSRSSYRGAHVLGGIIIASVPEIAKTPSVRRCARNARSAYAISLKKAYVGRCLLETSG